MGFHAETTSLRASVPLADSAVVRPDGRWCALARALARHSLRCGARAAFAITRRPGRSRRLPRAGPAARSVRDGGHALVCESPQAPGIRRAGPGDWLSGRAPRSHRGGHWFDPSIAHPGTSRSVTRSDPRCLAFLGSCPVWEPDGSRSSRWYPAGPPAVCPGLRRWSSGRRACRALHGPSART